MLSPADLETVLRQMTLRDSNFFDLLYFEGKGEISRVGPYYHETTYFGALRIKSLPGSRDAGLNFFYFYGDHSFFGGEIKKILQRGSDWRQPVEVLFKENPDPTKKEENQVILIPKMDVDSGGLTLKVILGAKLDVRGIKPTPHKSMAQQYREQGARYTLPTITGYVLKES